MSDYIPPAIGAEAKKNLDGVYSDALSKTPGLLAADSMEGVNEARSMENRDDGYSLGLGQGQDQSSLSSAIKGRSKAQFDGEYNNLEHTAKTNAQNRYFKRLQQATTLATQESQVNQQIAMAKYQARQRKKAARAQMLGTLLGVAGAVGGGIAGGPAGAMAGMTVGQGAGAAASGEAGGGL